METHFSYGSGMKGCLYDFGPNFCSDKSDAIESLLSVFSDSIVEEEETELRKNLTETGYHAFRNSVEAGAQYCEISLQNGPCPENGEADA